MLPFLKSKRNDGTGISISVRSPDQAAKPELEAESTTITAVRAAAADLIKAIHNRDERAAAEALRAAFEILEAMPHSEGPHTNEE